MSIAGTEALAGLQLLVAIAEADGELTARERAFIGVALEDANLPPGITAGALIASSYDVDSQIAQVASQDARDVALVACRAIAHVHSACAPRERAILDRIETAWLARVESPSGRGVAFHPAQCESSS